MWFRRLWPVPRFRDLRRPYLDAKQGRKKKTLWEAEYFSNRLVEFFGDLPLSKISEETWKLYEAHCRVTTPGRKLQHDHKHFVAMIRLAFRERKIPRLLEIPRPKQNRNAGREYTMEEILAMMEEASSCHNGVVQWGEDLHDQIAIATLGMRKMEVLELSWERVDLEKRTIRLRDVDTKTEDPREVHMSDRVHEVLTRRFERKSGPYVFPHKDDGTRPRTSNTSSWTTLKRKLGIRGRWHDHRCTAASRLLRSGESETGTKMMLGMSARIVERYAQISQVDYKRVADKLDLPSNL